MAGFVMNIPQTLELARKHQQAGRFTEAESLYRQILQRQPKRDDVLQQLAVLVFRAGRLDEAERLLNAAIAANFRKPEYHYQLGLVLRAMQRFDDAIGSFNRAIDLRPGFAEAQNDLGILLCQRNQIEEGISQFKSAASAKPDFVAALNNLGNAYTSQSRFDEAIAAFRKALQIRPDYVEGLSNLSNALCIIGQYDEAISTARRAIELRPDYPPAHNNLGNAYWHNDQPDEAIAACQRALELAPDAPQALNNLGNSLRSTGDLEQAIVCYRRAIELKPNDAAFGSNLVFVDLYDPAQTAETILQHVKDWNQRYAIPLRPLRRRHDNDPNPDRPLRIGYVSSDLRAHPVGRNLLPLLLNHDHKQFQIFCYSNSRSDDAVTKKFRAASDGWREIAGLGDTQAADAIVQDKIDILVDLSGHTANNRLPLFALKPAPIQATFGCYPSGTGLETIDYRLTDPHLDPPEIGDAFYTEQLIRLPGSFWCYDPDAMEVRDIPTSPLPASQNGFITFGCLNNFCKINPSTLRLWSKVLTAMPTSRLLLLAPHGSAQKWVLHHLAVDPSRIEFIPNQKREDYFRTYHRIDVGLDTLPYNGHTTSLDSFWMAVPVVTLIGAISVGRAGWSQLSNLKLQDLAARDEAQFVKIAVDLASDLPRLSALRAELRERMLQSPLTDSIRFARNIESAYRQVWRLRVAPNARLV
jgi:protein O-GlcNAc transferase